MPAAARERSFHAFTVDVEEWFQVSAFEHLYPSSSWDELPSRLELGLRRILDLCDAHGIRGTFFVLGWIADRHPRLVAEIRERGHELGSHSYFHRLVYELDPAAFRDDVRRSLDAIEAAANTRPTLFRAPSFSVVRESLWALDVLAAEGITIDSSVFPVHHDRYGIPGAPRGFYRPAEAGGRLVEAPPATVRWLGTNVPCLGGGYLRLYPLLVNRLALRSLEREGRAAVLYVHPWELDPDQPRPPAGPVTILRHRVGISRLAERLATLLSSHDFAPLGEVVASIGPEGLPLTAAGGPS